jgi:FkbM family methyltransferase
LWNNRDCLKVNNKRPIKDIIKLSLQKIIGFQNYLFAFFLFKIYTLKYDKSENDFLHFMGLIKKDGIILDIGANIGLMTVSLGKKFKNSQVFSFEPIPYNSSALKRNISFFNLKNVKVFDFALGNKNGEMEMVMPEVDSVKMQGLCHVIDESIPKKSKGEKFTIDIKRLDDLKGLKNLNLPIVGIKIDVEHFEWAVLEGAKEILKKYKPVIYCELCSEENRKRSFDILNNLNYTAKIAKGNFLIDFERSQNNCVNFIFIPQ